ncbi:MAG: S41 family peptidase [Mycoplasmatales bacterium]
MRKNLLIFISGILVTLFVVVLIGFNFIVPIKYYISVNSKFDGSFEKSTMLEKTLEGITNGFGDPHTSYIPKSELEKFNQSLNTSYQGIGIIYNVNEELGSAQVTKVMAGSPASQQDFYPGDFVKVVNGIVVDNTNVKDLSSMIKENKDVTLQLYRPSTEQTIDISMQQDSYVTDSVYSRTYNEGDNLIGYIQIISFSNTTADEFEKHLTELENKGMKKLIIDVRDDGGGELNAVEKICDLIVANTKPYLIIKENDKIVDQKTSKLQTPKEYEIIGLQNGNTASASEILMGAIKEINGSQIIGNKSYGKGSVQRIYPVVETGGAVKITIQHWFSPDGNSIDKVGIEPTKNINLEDTYIPVEPIVINEKLSLGYSGALIRQLNYYLYVNGYSVDKNSYTFSNDTKNAVQQLQADNGLEVTGIIDVQTAKVVYERALINVKNPVYDAQLSAAIGA